MPSIINAYNWLITKCQSDNVGYSQEYRCEQTVNGITYYDCSSIIWYSLINGGFGVESIHGSYPFTTSNMGNVLTALGFTRYEATSVEWLVGDIVWKNGHCEMVYDKQVTMGAHQDGVPLADQVSINEFSTDKSYYTYLYRYDVYNGLNWISGNRYLSKTEMKNNAKLIWKYFSSLGWSLNAVSAMLGNMQSESTINPGIWESLTVNTSRGFGLVQWTPATKLIDWAGSSYTDGYKQCERIQYESDNGLQWFRNPEAPIIEPPISFKDFTKSVLDVQTLANYFLWYYEHPKTTIQPNRASQALEWYTYLSELPPVPPTPTPTQQRKKMPLYMYTLIRW